MFDEEDENEPLYSKLDKKILAGFFLLYLAAFVGLIIYLNGIANG